MRMVAIALLELIVRHGGIVLPTSNSVLVVFLMCRMESNKFHLRKE